jgi:hypothetical protein
VEASRGASRESLFGGGFLHLLVLVLEFGLTADVDEEKRHSAEGKKDDASEQNTEDTAHGERVVRVEREFKHQL